MIQWNPILCRYVSHPYLAGVKPDSPQVIEAIYPPEWDEMDFVSLRNAAKSWYMDHILNTSSEIEVSGIKVVFTKKGLKKMLSQFGGKIDPRLLKAIPVLPKMVAKSRYLNADMEKSNYDVMLNYKVPVRVEGKIVQFKICVGIACNGQFYYTHLLIQRK